MTYLITGATGNIGSLVVERLLERGHRPRIFVRNAEKARARYADRVDSTVGDLADATSLAAALEKSMRSSSSTQEHGLEVRDEAAGKAAKAAGVKHLVKLSSYDAREQNVGTGVWHARGESAIRAAGSRSRSCSHRGLCQMLSFGRDRSSPKGSFAHPPATAGSPSFIPKTSPMSQQRH